VPTTERTGAVYVRAGKGERPRTVPLPVDARTQLRRWLEERARHPAARLGEPALWRGRRGRLSPRQLQRIVTDLRAAAGLEVSAHTLCGRRAVGHGAARTRSRRDRATLSGGGAAEALAAAIPDLRRLAAANVAMLSPPDPRLRMLTTEVHGQLRALATRPTAAALPAALGWVREAPAVAAALPGAAQAATWDGLLLIRPVESRRGNSRWSDMRWLPVTSPEELQRHPLLTQLCATRDALTAAQPALDQALAAVAPSASDAAVRRAALAAGRAGEELRTALNTRRGLPTPLTAMPAHPTLRPKPATKLPGPRL